VARALPLRTLRTWLAPSRTSLALLGGGLALTVLAFWPAAPRQDADGSAVRNPYQLPSWESASAERGLASMLSFGRVLGPMLLFAAIAHARQTARDEDELAREPTDETPSPLRTDATTLRRISFVLPRARASALERTLASEPIHAHRALPSLAEAIREAGHLEHVERAVPGAHDAGLALAHERRAIDARIDPHAHASYRGLDRAETEADGGHAVVSWVIVTRTDLDPWIDVPRAEHVARWVEELVPLRPEDTLALDVFVTPRVRGADEAVLRASLDLEPLA
jgi:uncharacterized membrane protein YidH (DUF202 family)